MAERLDEKAAAIAGAITTGVLHFVMGIFFFGMAGSGTGMYNMMMYLPANPVQVGFTQILYGTIASLIIGAIIGLVVAVSYNWALKKS